MYTYVNEDRFDTLRNPNYIHLYVLFSLNVVLLRPQHKFCVEIHSLPTPAPLNAPLHAMSLEPFTVTSLEGNNILLRLGPTEASVFARGKK